jgi:hypothetical protein
MQLERDLVRWSAVLDFYFGVEFLRKITFQVFPELDGLDVRYTMRFVDVYDTVQQGSPNLVSQGQGVDIDCARLESDLQLNSTQTLIQHDNNCTICLLRYVRLAY